jgi:hypothetical protein
MTLVECGAAAAAAFPLPSHLCHASVHEIERGYGVSDRR